MPGPKNLLLALLSLSGSVVAAQETTRIALVATSDIQGKAYHWNYLRDSVAPGGLTRFASVMDSLSSIHENRLVTLDAGNTVSGSTFSTYYETARRDLANPLADALLALRYDVVSPGIKDLRPGISDYQAAFAPTRIPIIASNLVLAATGEPPFDRSVVFRRAGISVGVAAYLSQPGGIDSTGFSQAGLRFEGSQTVAAALASIDAADIRILVVNSNDPVNLPANLVSTTGRRPHLVVRSGRGRATISRTPDGVPVVHPDSSTAVVVEADITLGGAEPSVALRPGLVSFANSQPQPQLVRRFDQSHQEVRRWATGSIAAANGVWTAREALIEDRPLIDFLNQVLLINSEAQLAATRVNNPWLSFGPGPVRVNDLLALYPDRTRLVAIGISGRQLRQLLEKSAERYSMPPDVPDLGLADIVSGVEYTIDLSNPPGNRVTSLRYQNRDVGDRDVFSIALDERIMTGEFSGYEFLHNRAVLRSWQKPIQDMLVEFTRRAGTLVPEDYYQPSWQLTPDSLVQTLRAALGLEVAETGPAMRIVVLSGIGAFLDNVEHLARVSSWLDTLSARCGCETYPVVVGSVFSGSTLNEMTGGAAGVDVFNAMSIAAVRPDALELAETDSLGTRATDASFAILADSAVPYTSPSLGVQARGAELALASSQSAVESGTSVRLSGTEAAMYRNGRLVSRAPVPTDSMSALVIDITSGLTGVEFNHQVATWNAGDVAADELIPEVLSTHQQRVAIRAQTHVARFLVPGSHDPAATNSYGRLIADAVRNESETRASIVSPESAWHTLPADSIRYGDLRGAYGKTRVRTVEITGHELRALFEANLSDELSGAWVSGVVVSYRPQADRGSRVADVRTPDDQRLENDEIYSVALVGDVAIPNLIDPTRIRTSDLLLADALATYLPLLPQPVTFPSNRRIEVD